MDRICTEGLGAKESNKLKNQWLWQRLRGRREKTFRDRSQLSKLKRE